MCFIDFVGSSDHISSVLTNLRAESQVKFSLIIEFSQFVFLRGDSNIQILFALEGPHIHHNRVKVAPLKNLIAISIQTVKG